MAASDMKGRKMLLAARMARDIHVLFLLCSKSATTARGFEPLRADSDTLSCFGENALAGNFLFPSLVGTKWPELLLLDLNL